MPEFKNSEKFLKGLTDLSNLRMKFHICLCLCVHEYVFPLKERERGLHKYMTIDSKGFKLRNLPKSLCSWHLISDKENRSNCV